MGFLKSLKTEIKTELNAVTDAAKQSISDFKAESTVPAPPPDAPLADCLDYLEAVAFYIGPRDTSAEYVSTPNGPVWPIDVRLGVTREVVALCRANIETNPDLVRAIIDPLLAVRRDRGPLLGKNEDVTTS